MIPSCSSSYVDSSAGSSQDIQGYLHPMMEQEGGQSLLSSEAGPSPSVEEVDRQSERLHDNAKSGKGKVKINVMSCPFCRRLFFGEKGSSGVMSNFRRHLYSHTSEGLFHCAQCSAEGVLSTSFATRQSLMRHIKTHHSTEVLCCSSPNSPLLYWKEKGREVLALDEAFNSCSKHKVLAKDVSLPMWWQLGCPALESEIYYFSSCPPEDVCKHPSDQDFSMQSSRKRLHEDSGSERVYNFCPSDLFPTCADEYENGKNRKTRGSAWDSIGLQSPEIPTYGKKRYDLLAVEGSDVDRWMALHPDAQRNSELYDPFEAQMLLALRGSDRTC